MKNKSTKRRRLKKTKTLWPRQLNFWTFINQNSNKNWTTVDKSSLKTHPLWTMKLRLMLANGQMMSTKDSWRACDLSAKTGTWFRSTLDQGLVHRPGLMPKSSSERCKSKDFLPFSLAQELALWWSKMMVHLSLTVKRKMYKNESPPETTRSDWIA